MSATQVKNKKNNQDTAVPLLYQRLSEGLFIFIMAIAFFILLSLLTYQFKFSAAAGVAQVGRNAGGKVGTLISNAFFYAFGYLSYLVPIALGYLSLSLLRQRSSWSRSFEIILVKSIGFLLSFISLCSMASLIDLHVYQQLPKSGGGVVGLYVAQFFYRFFEIGGSFILFSGLCLGGITLMTNVSWVRFVEVVGRFSVKLIHSMLAICGYTKQWLKQLGERYRAWRTKHAPSISNEYSKGLRSKRSSKTKAEVPSDDEYQEAFFETTSVKPIKIKVSERFHKQRQKPLFKTQGNEALPPLTLLQTPTKTQAAQVSHAELEARSREVEQRLSDFGVDVKVVAVHPGPVITRFELQLAPGLKVSKITALGKDLARSLSVISVRVVEVIPGKSVVGLELPNQQRDIVCLSEVLTSETYDKAKSSLTLALGVDIAGQPMMVDLAKMPHLLVAGTTGSGKSVGINAMILSLLFKSTPDEVRLILVDPKMLELSVYDGIPHLLTPVVTDMKDAASALRWSVMEMERRYRLMAALGVRNIAGFNAKVKDAIKANEPIKDPLWHNQEGEEAPTLVTLPKIVVIIDELADMMMVVGKKVEQLIARIAQKARAAGIHLILATQRPSVDVLTGLIKSNIPTRISFQVSSKIDSRTILDQQGAEQLLGHGDMLYLAPGTGAPIRVHGAFVEDSEVHQVAEAWRQLGTPDYIESITQCAGEGDELGLDGGGEQTEDVDALYDEAVAFVTQARKASISSVQRRFKIGYNRAARLVEEMERTGVVGPMEGGSRDVLAPAPPHED